MRVVVGSGEFRFSCLTKDQSRLFLGQTERFRYILKLSGELEGSKLSHNIEYINLYILYSRINQKIIKKLRLNRHEIECLLREKMSIDDGNLMMCGCVVWSAVVWAFY